MDEFPITLTKALREPRVWWVVNARNPTMAPLVGQNPARVEVLEILEGPLGQSKIALGYEATPARFSTGDYDAWDAYRNFWHAWAAVQRGAKHE